jgi:predicted NBD/HSP70 family sugar kinase
MITRLPSKGDAEARNARHLRHLNLERLLSAAMDRTEPFTRAELTEATALSAPTVGTLTVELIRNGLIRHLGTGPSRGGRRPSFMEFNARYGFVAGISLGATKTRAALADLRGARLASRAWPTPAGLGPQALLQKIAGYVRGLMGEAGIAPDKLLAVTAAAPGAVDHTKGTVIALAPNLKGWSQVPMGEILKESLGGVPVFVENDVNLAILGERWQGAARGHNTCAFLYVGSGIGAGIVVNGELHRGHHHLAGEIALMCMGPQYVDEDFGSTGCLETLASIKALATRWGGGDNPGSGGPHREKRAEDLFAAADKGEKRARKLIEDAARLVGIAATNLSLVIDPSLLVIGGPAVEHEYFMDQVRQVVAKIIPAPPEIVPAKLGKEAPLWGSLLLATNEARVSLRERLRT